MKSNYQNRMNRGPKMPFFQKEQMKKQLEELDTVLNEAAANGKLSDGAHLLFKRMKAGLDEGLETRC